FFARHIAWIETRLRQGQADGSVRASLEPAAQARLVVAGLEGALVTERLLGGAEGFGVVIEALRESLTGQASSATNP
ncbi:hypothetical protein, partial [Klebsiella michiganensis]|uniref:hypothetical protein n=1 Tax=Klebsiella michiganensis TaxID=1134687 RepID=UPI0019549DC4